LNEKIEEMGLATVSATNDMTGILEQAQPKLEGYALTYKKVMKEMSEAQMNFTDMALNEFMAMELSLKGFVGAILNIFEKWAIGQIIPKIMAALPFPINLLAVGGAIGTVRAIFAGIKGMKEGGVVMQEGIYRLHPKEMVLPIEKAPQLMREMTSPESPPQKIIIQNSITIGEQTFYRESVRSVNKAGELGDLIVPNKVVI